MHLKYSTMPVNSGGGGGVVLGRIIGFEKKLRRSLFDWH